MRVAAAVAKVNPAQLLLQQPLLHHNHNAVDRHLPAAMHPNHAAVIGVVDRTSIQMPSVILIHLPRTILLPASVLSPIRR